MTHHFLGVHPWDVQEPIHIVSPSGVEVFEREEAVGDGRPAGWRAGQRENASSHGTWDFGIFLSSGVPPVVGLPCYELISTRLS